MDSVAFNLRGTNGSGKTTVARALLDKSNAQQRFLDNLGIFYQAGQLYGRPFYAIGKYSIGCGGCDTVPSVFLVASALEYFMSKQGAIVFYEGLLISHSYGTVGKLADSYADRHLTGFLDTPLEVCIERVVKRRMDRGDTRPFCAERTLTLDHKNVERCYHSSYKDKRPCVVIPHQNAVEHTVLHIKRLVDGHPTRV